ncbi:MAG: IS256 family transposase [Anaeroplasmataceae bacterium]
MKSISNFKELLEINSFIEIIEKNLEVAANDESAKLAKKGIKLIRNGYYSRTLHTELGTITVNVPRFRNHAFKNKYLEDTSYSYKMIKLCISLYGQGLSTNRISQSIYETYNIDISKQTISNFCTVMNKDVDTYFESNYSNEVFVAIYIDAKYFSVRDVLERNKSALMTAIGLTISGKLVHLHMDVLKREGYSEIKSFLEVLQSKVNSKSIIFITDGGSNFKSAISEVFPKSKIQRCLVHIVRNIKKSISKVADAAVQKEMEDDFNGIFFGEDSLDFKEEIKVLVEKYSEYSKIIGKILSDVNIYTFLSFNDEFSKIIKTNNIIEQFHANLEAVTAQHKTFNTKQSLYRAIIQEVNRFDSRNNQYDFIIEEENNNFNIKNIFSNNKSESHIIVKVIVNGTVKISEIISSVTLSKIVDILPLM